MDEESLNYNEADEYDVSEVVVETGGDEDINTVLKGYKNKLKYYKTSPSLTKYERCKVIGGDYILALIAKKDVVSE